MNKIWLTTFTKDNQIETQEISVIKELTIKYELPKIVPFDIYSYIHKHNLNIVQSCRKNKIHYVVSLSKEEGLEVVNDWITDKLAKYNSIVDNLNKLHINLLKIDEK